MLLLRGLIIFLNLNAVLGLRILFYVSIFGKSHLDYSDSLINVLTEKGHTVDLVIARINDKVVGNGRNTAERVYSVEFTNGSLWGNASHLVDPFEDCPFYYGDFREWNSIGHALCEIAVNDDSLLHFIAEKRYDIAVTSTFDFCAVGMVALFEIPAVVTTSAVPLTPLQSIIIGLPTVPSTTIPLFQSADLTTLFGKFWNVVNWAYIHHVQIPEVFRIQEDIFKRRFGKTIQFSLKEVVSRIDVSFINSNEIMEKPRPLSHRVQYIGGINLPDPKPLDAVFDRLLSEKTVIFSFGTQVAGNKYPRYAVRNFVNVFKRFPEYTFLWKYDVQEDEEQLFEAAPNVFPLDWLPQTDLLYDPRVVAFISHCGLNSFNEASFAGKPILAIPLFADQPHNTDNGVLRGTTVRLDKTKLSEKSIEQGLRAVLFDKSFTANAQMLQKMLIEKPSQPKDRFVQWVEYSAANPGLHRVFELPGARMGMIEYFCVDAVLYVTLVTVVFVFLMFKVSSFLLFIDLFGLQRKKGEYK
ncbi:unnamed protein product [Caenorhabditis sp. 36 PRJEB53466]|nr:unnamed protein product [Caenorhabditis sp. 36 PRJEB53466]